LHAKQHGDREFGEQLAAADWGAASETGAGEDFAPKTLGRQGDLGPEIGWAAVTVETIGQVRRDDDERLVAVASGKSAKPVRDPAFPGVERLVIASGGQFRVLAQASEQARWDKQLLTPVLPVVRDLRNAG